MLLDEVLASYCLVICSKTLNYLPTSTYDLNQKSNSAPLSSDVIATSTNPRQIGLTDGDLGHTKMGL